MFRAFLVILLAVPLTALAPAATAYHDCGRNFDPSVGGFFFPPNDRCAGAAIGLGPEFRCPGASAHVDPVWVSVLASFGCTVGVIVELP